MRLSRFLAGFLPAANAAGLAWGLVITLVLRRRLGAVPLFFLLLLFLLLFPASSSAVAAVLVLPSRQSLGEVVLVVANPFPFGI